VTFLGRSPRARELLTFRFLTRVRSSFLANQGLLLAGAIAFYTLFSIVPLFAVLLIALSKLVDREQLMRVVFAQLQLIAPGSAVVMMKDIETFLDHREVVGSVGVIVMIVFGSLAFSVLERAMAVIFAHRKEVHRRRFLTSVLIPYLYMGAIGVGLLLVALMMGFFQTLEKRELILYDTVVSLDGTSSLALQAVLIASEVVMFSSLYIVLPVGLGAWKHAFLGGAFATILWEATRRLMVWYFSTLSMVTTLYGSLSTTILALLTMEAASIVILLGAQVIAEYERLPKLGGPTGRLGSGIH
jgi:membrane protein